MENGNWMTVLPRDLFRWIIIIIPASMPVDLNPNQSLGYRLPSDYVDPSPSKLRVFAIKSYESPVGFSIRIPSAGCH
jgi:hypothetical protein